jgi:hypothetical protein
MRPLQKSRHALAWLRSEPGFAPLGEQARRLSALQDDLQLCAPTLRLSVISLVGGSLSVSAEHPAMAAKLRQTAPTLVAAMTHRGWKISRIRFKPQIGRAPPPVRPPKAPPGDKAVAMVAAAADTIHDPALRAAMKKFAARHSQR